MILNFWDLNNVTTECINFTIRKIKFEVQPICLSDKSRFSFASLGFSQTKIKVKTAKVGAYCNTWEPHTEDSRCPPRGGVRCRTDCSSSALCSSCRSCKGLASFKQWLLRGHTLKFWRARPQRRRRKKAKLSVFAITLESQELENNGQQHGRKMAKSRRGCTRRHGAGYVHTRLPAGSRSGLAPSSCSTACNSHWQVHQVSARVRWTAFQMLGGTEPRF